MSRSNRRTARIAAHRTAAALLAVAGLWALSLQPATGAPAAASAFVRVNQVGYPGGAAKRAYLMSSVPETGASFSVGSFTAPVGASLGSWSSTFRYVYALDFDSVTAAGSY